MGEVLSGRSPKAAAGPVPTELSQSHIPKQGLCRHLGKKGQRAKYVGFSQKNAVCSTAGRLGGHRGGYTRLRRGNWAEFPLFWGRARRGGGWHLLLGLLLSQLPRPLLGRERRRKHR